ncbi:tRNA (adenosine(37)-N6)-threonylcarbamoyltransferase complex dimerization subunit type 1 TsaB [Candidatus Curculioniphilus buchneri]|uniref:tRNA (adenosine(37)-N6)-threonylcarbamoyltransferase complex dimerization subunit type 1 TsaB n=1 Tax=Candidatus Curculioniphilus buchneri TaxID=690594 RepID=UPI00376F19C4
MPVHILALDTVTEACSAALLLDNNNIIERYAVIPRKHIQQILPMVDSLLTEARITLNDLDALAFSRGPGSFIGIRICTGIAQGLALGIGLPLISISTLALLAEGAWRRTGIDQVLTAIDASMGEIYWAKYQRKTEGVWLCQNNEVILTPDILAKQLMQLRGRWAIAGTGWKTYPTLLDIKQSKVQIVSGHTLPNAYDMLPLALHDYNHGDVQPVQCAKPIYLRNKVT